MKDNQLIAALGWIDFSPADRARVGTVLDMLKPEGMVDELGLSTIRDALANQLFPGISTIQTRAKYFFIVPYILSDFQHLPSNTRKKRNAAQYLEQREYEIMWELAATYEYQDGHGVIGVSKRKPQKIARRPSTVYWGGLNRYGLIDARGLSPDAFLRQTFQRRLTDLLSDREGDDAPRDDADAGYENEFGIRLKSPANWDINLRLELTRTEAEILRSRIIDTSGQHLVAQLLEEEVLWHSFAASKSFMEFARATKAIKMEENLRHLLVLAHDFSSLMYGAHLLYNHMLQQRTFSNTHFQDLWQQWKAELPDRMINYETFDPEHLFHHATTTRELTSQFVREWWKEAKAGFTDSGKLHKMIESQENFAKGHKARLRWNKTYDVPEKKWIGLEHFAYRFKQGKDILTDIQNAL